MLNPLTKQMGKQNESLGTPNRFAVPLVAVPRLFNVWLVIYIIIPIYRIHAIYTQNGKMLPTLQQMGILIRVVSDQVHFIYADKLLKIMIWALCLD